MSLFCDLLDKMTSSVVASSEREQMTMKQRVSARLNESTKNAKPEPRDHHQRITIFRMANRSKLSACNNQYNIALHILQWTFSTWDLNRVLAHLSWAYSIGRHPLSVRPSVSIFKWHLLWSHEADSYQISHIATIGGGKWILAFFLFFFFITAMAT